MSVVGSSTISGTPSAFLILLARSHLRAEVGDRRRHDDDVGIVGAARAPPRSISAAVLTRTTSTPAAAGRSAVVTSVTVAPRAAASSASAWPCLPDERLPMKRTGSIASRVPPAVTSTCRPREIAWRQDGRSTAATMSLGSARRPAPTSPPARRPVAGVTTCTPRRAQRGRLSCTAGCSHISVCIAGHDDDRRARREQRRGEQVVRDARRRSCRAAERSRARRARDRRRWPSRVCGIGSASSHRDVRTRSDASAENVVSPDEAECAACQHRGHVGAGVDKAAAHLDRLVGRDPTAYPEDHSPAGERALRRHCTPPGSRR